METTEMLEILREISNHIMGLKIIGFGIMVLFVFMIVVIQKSKK